MDQDIELTSLRPLHRNTNNANDCEEGCMAEEAIFLTQSIGEASNEEDGNTCPICLETSGILVAGEWLTSRQMWKDWSMETRLFMRENDLPKKASSMCAF